MDLFYSIVGFILAISILVFIHELGHFLIARLFKVKVLKFSIGFGPGYRLGRDQLGTNYFISAIPLGGYVELLDTTGIDPIAKNNLINEFPKLKAINEQSTWIKVAILFAGPMFNFLFAWLIYVVVFMLGIASNLPIIGKIKENSLAAIAGLDPKLQITKINNHLVEDWNEIILYILKYSDRSLIKISTYDQFSKKTNLHYLNLRQLKVKSQLLSKLGIEPLNLLDPRINKVMSNSPAAISGLKTGDLIQSIDGYNINDPQQVLDYVFNKANQKLKFKVLRGTQELSFRVVPVFRSIKDPNLGAVIGIQYNKLPYPKEYTKFQKYGFTMSLSKAMEKTYNQIKLSGCFLISMLTGKLSLSNAAGPVAIGYYAGQSIKIGVEHFLNFLGIISINLGVLNLLPLPWLDGGGILYYLYEQISRGKTIPLKLSYIIRTLTLFLLIGFAMLVLINDLLRL